MLSILTCIGTRHDPWLLFLASVVCCVGSMTTIRLVQLTTRAPGTLKIAWSFLTASVTGAAIWCTHFIAIDSFNAGIPIALDPVMTILSLIVAIGGCFAGFMLVASGRGGLRPTLSGVVIGLSISAMHYAGMQAFRIDGIVRWHEGYVAASVLLAVVLSALAMVAANAQLGERMEDWAAVLLFAATLSLHLTGMAAIEIIPLAHQPQASELTSSALALVTALVGTLIIAAGAFAHKIDLHSRRDTKARLAWLKMTDHVTGLPNLSAFEKDLERLLDQADADQRIAVMTIHFRSLDGLIERYGRIAGELVAKALAERVEQNTQPGFFTGRTGAGELTVYAILREGIDVDLVSRQVHAFLSQPLAIGELDIALDPRIGVACFPHDATRTEGLLRCSRQALSRASLDPLEPISLYEQMTDEAAQRRHDLAVDLRGALANGEFEVHYQPQVRISDRSIIGYEALLRWNHPRFGAVSPAEFIPLAERMGDIIPIGIWVLETACAEAAGWLSDWSVSVNLSPLQLRQPDLPKRVLEALVRSGLSPARLEIELTESLFVADSQRALHVLRQIRAMGVRLALDDFGAGYSSLDVLRKFPFDKVKLDKSFVDDIQSNPRSLAILRTMLDMGRNLNVPVLAEGVETEIQLAILRDAGCRKVQGYLTGRPTAASEIVLAPERLGPWLDKVG